MGTVVFVHGTGVRKVSFEQSLAQVEKNLGEALRKARRPPIRVLPCLWGDSLGSRLNAGGASVPDYLRTGQVRPGTRDDVVLLWEMLGYDSLYELRGLALRPMRNAIEVEEFRGLVKALPSAELTESLREAGLADTFAAARDFVLNEGAFQDALRAATDVGDCRGPVARAIIAEAAARAWTAEPSPPTVLTDPTLRDALVEAVSADLGEPTRGAAGWLTNKLFNLAQRIGLIDLRYRRGQLTDAVCEPTGDVLLYLAAGHDLRQFIRSKVEQVRKDGPVTLLAHSLGGIASVDLLAGADPPSVDLLVTAGSQAPYLYEINALPSLRFPKPLPAGFPPWINVYDRRDLLGYIAGRVFGRDGENSNVTDLEVDNGLAFPESHSGYWSNTALWDALVPLLP